MPSFRIAFAVGTLRAGVDPASVLPAAAAAARELTIVEASDLGVVAGTARITVRFTAEGGDLARQIGDHVVAQVTQLAALSGIRVTERVGGRWYAVR
jgi:hypothetical protein